MAFIKASPAVLVLCGTLMVSFNGPLPASDCNRNGLEDPADIASGSSEDCNQNGIPDECEGAPLLYDLKYPQIPVDKNPRSIAAGDLNGDGLPDLAITAGAEFSSVWVFRSGGAEGFDPPRAYPAVDNAGMLLAIDLDGDGALDLVTVNPDSISTFRGQGDGRLGAPVNLPVEGKPNSITAGDLDGDGRLDLVTANQALRTFSILKQKEDGGLFPPATMPAVENPRSITVGDFDGDGQLDLAVRNFSSGEVSIFRNLSDGRFENSGTLSAEPYFESFAAGDLDGDGDLDLVATGSKHLYFHFNELKNGFRAMSIPTLGTVPASVNSFDLDGDGDLDLSVTASADVGRLWVLEVWRNDEGWKHHEISSTSIRRNPSPATAADFEGDGLIDLALVNQRDGFLGVFGQVEEKKTIDLRKVEVSLPPKPHWMDLADLDEDGSLDMAIADFGAIVVLLNGGDGTFHQGTGNVELPLTTFFKIIKAGDINGDGKPDLIAGYAALGAYLNQGHAIFAAPTRIQSIGQNSRLAIADLDRDGDIDLVTTDGNVGTYSVSLNDSSGKFETGPNLQISYSLTGPIAGDLDLDGDMDLAMVSPQEGAVFLFANPGSAKFGGLKRISCPGPPTSMAIGELDGDHLLDLAVAGEGFLSLFYADGNLQYGVPVNYPSGDHGEVVVVDLNRNGALDVVTGPGDIWSHVNVGGRIFNYPVQFKIEGADLLSLGAGDLDGDGNVDLAALNHETNKALFIFNDTLPWEKHGYRESICTQSEYYELSIPVGGSGEVKRVAKFLLPARDDPSLLPPVYQNSNIYPLHQEFLALEFPARFPALGPEEYRALVALRATRQYYAGDISLIHSASGITYGFNAYTDSARSEVLTQEEVGRIYNTLLGSFHLRLLAYSPSAYPAIEAAGKWVDPGFPIYLGREPTRSYQAYTRATGYGWVRILSADQFESTNRIGLLGWQDILVLERSPRDIEGVVAGVITAEPQGELSHLTIRTARRRTPNAFLEGAVEALRPFAEKLVRLEVKESEYRISETTLAEAQSWWALSRPRLSEEPRVDGEYGKLDSLAEMDLGGAAGSAEARFGGKATNLARLQRILTGPHAKYQEVGFAIPLRYSLEFLRTNRIDSMLEPFRQVSYEEYLHEIFTSPFFQSDSLARFEVLEMFRAEIERHGVVDPALITEISRRIKEVFGSDDLMVRFRSSSNIEDSLEFNGAGLYESASACAADELDADAGGPSRCDPRKADERGIADAVRQVWASLWTFRAVEERAYYQIPPESAAMGVLVSRAFLDERANGVAFTGNPSNPADRRYVVTAQVGEASVVSPEPGVSAEVDLLRVEGGTVLGIDRAKRSSLAPEGERVLSVDQLRELGALLWHMDQEFPLDLGAHRREEVLLDIEFKIEADGQLSMKQIRPFLAAPPEPTPTFELEIPENAVACGVFLEGRGLKTEHELKSRIDFRSGRVALPTRDETFPGDIFREVRLGPAGEVVAPRSPGVFHRERLAGVAGRTVYRFQFEQEFETAEGQSFTVKLLRLDYQTKDGEPVEASRTIDENFLISEMVLEGGPVGEGEIFIHYSSCSYETLPLWSVEADLEGGASLRLEQRLLPSTITTGPGALVHARLVLPGRTVEISDYHRLVYSAIRHNRAEGFWMLLGAPLAIAGVEKPVVGVEFLPADPTFRPAAVARYLGADLEGVASPQVLSFKKSRVEGDGKVRFRRGDVEADGSVSLTDAIALLEYLYRSGARPPCRKAADLNDDGSLNVLDAMLVLLHLFQGRQGFPAPFEACGLDPTENSLDCRSFLPCR